MRCLSSDDIRRFGENATSGCVYNLPTMQGDIGLGMCLNVSSCSQQNICDNGESECIFSRGYWILYGSSIEIDMA